MYSSEHPIPSETQLSGLLVQPLAERIREWYLAGKLDEGDLERALSNDGHALVDHPVGSGEWVPLSDVEGLVTLVAEQLGGEAGLADWASEIVEGWQGADPVRELVQVARSLVDAPGFVVSQASELLVCEPDWRYDGGRSAFAVRLRGVEAASSSLKALLGALLARLANAVQDLAFDVRFEGVDADELVVFGEIAADGEIEGEELQESRLHRAALVG
ncbi:MAG: hypothetical protein CL908_17570 [Deltaproteobacteria bacterium]|nr:hypothetical protein [Deltaproteobacteria bacterium]